MSIEAGRTLVFEAQRLSTAYSGVAAYVLTWNKPAPAMKAGLTRWEYPPLPEFRRVERNSFFVPSAPPGDDPWLWDLLIGDGSPWPYPWDPTIGEFELPGLPGGLSGPVPVRIRFAGASSHTHTIEARINGEPVGMRPHPISQLPPGSFLAEPQHCDAWASGSVTSSTRVAVPAWVLTW